MPTSNNPKAAEDDQAVESSQRNVKHRHLTYIIPFVRGVVIVFLSIVLITVSNLGMAYGHVTGWVLPALPVVVFVAFFAFHHLSVWWWNRKGTEEPRSKSLLFWTGAYAIATSVALYVLSIVGNILMSLDIALNPTYVAARISGNVTHGTEGIGGFLEIVVLAAITVTFVVSFVVLSTGAAQVRRRFFGTIRTEKIPSPHKDFLGRLHGAYVRSYNRFTKGPGVIGWSILVLAASTSMWILFGLSANSLLG